MRPPTRSRRPTANGTGFPEVSMTDEQDDQPVDIERCTRLVEQVLTARGVTGGAELGVVFVDEETMADLNRRYMAQDGPTDVLSFPLEPDDPGPAPTGGPPRLLGDIVVCPAVAAINAPDHAGSYGDELALLLVHGVLHVLGLDHVEADETEAMQARERELLHRFHGPMAGDPWAPVPR